MGLNPGTFLSRLDQIITGNGFKRSIQIPVHDFFLSSSGAPLTTTLTTNPGFDIFETNLVGLAWAAGKVVKGGFIFHVPDDYDKSNDYLKIRIKALMAGSTDTPSIDATVYEDSVPATDLDPTKSGALSASAAWIEIDLSDNGLQAGDVLTINLFPEAHTSDAVEVYAVKMEYASDLVFYDNDDRSLE